MTSQSRAFPFLVVGGGIVVLALAAGGLAYKARKNEKDIEALRYAVQVLSRGDRTETEGYWVGDVAGLYALGRISRELAEADTAPIVPLVDVPRPFHGYYVRAMEGGPAFTESPVNVSLKGRRRCRETMAFCLYPADDDPQHKVIICGPHCFFPRVDGQRGVVLQWPTDQEIRQFYSIID